MNQLENYLWFEKYKENNTSQHGEDGIIEKIFSLIETNNRFIVECGAADGVKNSNAFSLISKKNWTGLLIEGDRTIYEKLKKNYNSFNSVQCVNSFVSFEGEESFDSIFSDNRVPEEFDLLILDIDGNEYHVWESMKKFRPRVVVVEFNQTIPNDIDFVQPKDMSVQQGSSLKSLVRLGGSLGYRLVAVTDINAFFVSEKDAAPFMHLNNDIDTLRPFNPYETKIFQLYDGTLKISGNKKLIWHKVEIDEEKLQVLSKNKRVYLNGISSSTLVRKIKYSIRNIPLLYSLVKEFRKIPFFKKIMY